MASYRYWRVKATTAPAFVGATEVQFRTSYRGEQAAVGGTAIADSSYPGTSPSNAFDNAHDEWASNGTGTNSWIGYDFGSPVEIVELAYTRPWNASSQIWTAANVDGSNDGVSWTTVASITATWSYGGETKVFTVQGSGPPAVGAGLGSHRYWRVRGVTLNPNSAGYLACGELIFRTQVGGPQRATGGTALADSSIGASALPAKAFDGLTTGVEVFWCSAGVGSPSWIGYDFGVARHIAEIVYTCRNASGLYQQIFATATIDSSDDGVTWNPAVAITAAAWTQGSSQTFTVQAAIPDSDSARPVVFVCT